MLPLCVPTGSGMIGDGAYQREAGNAGMAPPDTEPPEVRAQQDALLHTAQGVRVSSSAAGSQP